ncbi:hypothetical protein [Actinoplanes sp. NPDC049599]|uniref:hypothetical protein n=1 Tax=Actinoplanes sp. NPDC049599 TaxID=3363903 RepID=UPI003799771B
MNDLIETPAERELPPARAARMRAELLAAVAAPAPRSARRRLLVAAAAAVTLVVGAGVTLEVRQEDRTQVVALGPGELDQGLRKAVRQCVQWNHASYPAGTAPDQIPITAADVAVAARRGNETAVLFLTGAGYYGCGVTAEDGAEVSGGSSSGAWESREWLPGPVQRLSLSSSEASGGQVAVLGRVSARVDRLVLEHGTGRKTTARLRDGAFGLVSRTDDVRRDAELVSYDAAGREIDRRRLFAAGEDFPRCYADPAGRVVYGDPGPDCLPADRWTR